MVAMATSQVTAEASSELADGSSRMAASQSAAPAEKKVTFKSEIAASTDDGRPFGLHAYIGRRTQSASSTEGATIEKKKYAESVIAKYAVTVVTQKDRDEEALGRKTEAGE